MKLPRLPLLFGLLTVFCFASSVFAVDLKQVQKELAEGKAILIDVREQEEWDDAHLAQAILVPGSEIASGAHNEKVQQKLKTEPEQKIYCHCKSGGRAKLAARKLGKLGIEVIPITDSYLALVQAGFKQAAPK